jgi:hypothetical protein
VDAHFRDAFTHRFTIAKIAVLGGPDAMDDPSATRFVFQADKPRIEFFGAHKGIHATDSIQLDTYAQSGSQGTLAFVHAGCNAHVNREQVRQIDAVVRCVPSDLWHTGSLDGPVKST